MASALQQRRDLFPGWSPIIVVMDGQCSRVYDTHSRVFGRRLGGRFPVADDGERDVAMRDFRGNLSAAQQGDEEAFAAIWRHFQPGLLRYLKVKDATLADDLAADTWLKVLGALPAFEGNEAGFRAWLFTIARNRRTDMYRGAATRLVLVESSQLALLPDGTDVEVDAEEDLATDEILALISQLSVDQAEAVALRIVAGLDVSSVATIMGRSAGSVRVLCHRGLRALECKLNEEIDVADESVLPGEAEAGTAEPGAGLPLRPEVILHG
jgi:RNA polymerase sigma-70 factor (ECF subfamily)